MGCHCSLPQFPHLGISSGPLQRGASLVPAALRCDRRDMGTSLAMPGDGTILLAQLWGSPECPAPHWVSKGCPAPHITQGQGLEGFCRRRCWRIGPPLSPTSAPQDVCPCEAHIHPINLFLPLNYTQSCAAGDLALQGEGSEFRAA